MAESAPPTMWSQNTSQCPMVCPAAQQYQGQQAAPAAVDAGPATPAKREADDDVEFISSQPVKKKRVNEPGQSCPQTAQENLSTAQHPPASNPEAPSAVPTPEPHDKESTGTIGGPITPTGPETVESRGVSLPSMAKFSFPKNFPPPPTHPPRWSPAISPKQLSETVSPALLNADGPQTASGSLSFPGPFDQQLSSGGEIGFGVPHFVPPPVRMTMELASSHRILGPPAHGQGNFGAATAPETQARQASCQALSPRPQADANPHGPSLAQTNGGEQTQLVHPSVLNGTCLPRDAGAAQLGSPLRSDAQQSRPPTPACANAAPNRFLVGMQHMGLLRHPCLMCAKTRLHQQASAGPLNGSPSSPHSLPMSHYSCPTTHVMTPPTTATQAAMPVLAMPLNPSQMMNHSHAVGHPVSPSSNVSGVGIYPIPPTPSSAPMTSVTAQPGPVAQGVPKKNPTACSNPTANECAAPKTQDATSHPPSANAQPDKVSTATSVVIPKRKPPPNLIVDVAETAEEVFPFDEVARRHAVPRQKVVDVFAAVIQVPLLRVATDRRRTGKLGQARVKEFMRARKELVAARGPAARGDGNGTARGSGNANAHGNGAGGVGESQNLEGASMMPSNLELAMFMPPLQDIPAQFGGFAVP